MRPLKERVARCFDLFTPSMTLNLWKDLYVSSDLLVRWSPLLRGSCPTGLDRTILSCSRSCWIQSSSGTMRVLYKSWMVMIQVTRYQSISIRKFPANLLLKERLRMKVFEMVDRIYISKDSNRPDIPLDKYA